MADDSILNKLNKLKKEYIENRRDFHSTIELAYKSGIADVLGGRLYNDEDIDKLWKKSEIYQLLNGGIDSDF